MRPFDEWKAEVRTAWYQEGGMYCSRARVLTTYMIEALQSGEQERLDWLVRVADRLGVTFKINDEGVAYEWHQLSYQRERSAHKAWEL